VVRLLTAEQLTCVVVVDLYLEASGSVAVVVSCYKVHVLARGRDNARNLVRTLLSRCPSWALGDFVLSRVSTDTRVPPIRAHMACSVIFLEVEAPLEVIRQRLVLPRHFLIRIQQVPTVGNQSLRRLGDT